MTVLKSVFLNYKPGTRGEEVHFEVAKHESLVAHYETEVAGGAVELAPRLEQLRGDLTAHKTDLAEIHANPASGELPAIGRIDVKQSREVMTAVPPDGTLLPSSKLFSNEIADPALRSIYPNVRHIETGDTLTVNGEKISNLGVDLTASGSFRKHGGQVFVDDQSGTVILSVNMVTRANPKQLERVEVPYQKNNDGKWRADFSRHDKLSNSGANIRISEGVANNRTAHFSDANKQLTSLLEKNLQLKLNLALNGVDLNLVKAAVGDSPTPYTYHHSNSDGDLMLVDTNIHDMFTHTGGMADLKN